MFLIASIQTTSHGGWTFERVTLYVGFLAGIAALLDFFGVRAWLVEKVRGRRPPPRGLLVRTAELILGLAAIGVGAFASGATRTYALIGIIAALGISGGIRLVSDWQREHGRDVHGELAPARTSPPRNEAPSVQEPPMPANAPASMPTISRGGRLSISFGIQRQLTEGDELLRRIEKAYGSAPFSQPARFAWIPGVSSAAPPPLTAEDIRLNAYSKSVSDWTERVTELLGNDSLDLVDYFLGERQSFSFAGSFGLLNDIRGRVARLREIAAEISP